MFYNKEMSTDLSNLSIEELKKIKKDNQQKLKKEYSEYKEKQELIADIIKLQKAREKIKINIKPKPKPKSTKAKTFDEYFQDCIKNKTIPPDIPSYLRKALERALKEYDQGIEKEKSSLDEFANKYIVKGETNIIPFEFFKSKSTYLKDFLRNHRNIKVRFVLVCLMEKMIRGDKLRLTVLIHILILNQLM